MVGLRYTPYHLSFRVSALNRPDKKKRKKLMKDSLSLAAMIRRFTREKEEIRKKNPMPTGALKLPRGPLNANRALLNSNSAPPGNDLSMADLTNDPAVMSLLGSANDNEMLQDLMGDLDFALLDNPELSSPGQGENGSAQKGVTPGRVQRAGLMPPPPLPDGLPAPLTKRVEDLRAVSGPTGSIIVYLYITSLCSCHKKGVFFFFMVLVLSSNDWTRVGGIFCGGFNWCMNSITVTVHLAGLTSSMYRPALHSLMMCLRTA